MMRMARLKREHEPVEEAPPLGSRASEQTIHCRDEPDQLH
jgi:hypothetical protein